MCSLLENWIEKKELKEKFLDINNPLEIFGLKVDIPVIH